MNRADMRQWALTHTTVSATAAHVYWALMMHADDDGYSRPAVPTIAAECHLNRDSARRALRELQAAGEIVLAATWQNRPTVWQLAYQPAATPRPRGDRARDNARPRAGKRTAARGETAPKLERSLNYEGGNGAGRPPNGAGADTAPDPARNVTGTHTARETLAAARSQHGRQEP